MRYALPGALVVILLAASSLTARAIASEPASFSAAQSVTAASSAPGNSYAAGASVILTAPVAGDFAACGGSIVTAAPVAGDSLLFAGSVSSRSPVTGDLRVVAGNIDVNEAVGGDLFAVGLSMLDTGHVSGTTFIVAANATMDGGASGPVTIYGNNIALAGTFDGDVRLVAGGRVALAPGTVIRGGLSYDAPEKAVIPASSVVEGGVTYRDTSYLPNVGASHLLAFVSIGFFLAARIIGALILAGLFAGLFPAFAGAFIDRSVAMRLRSIFLTILLGFAICVATPIVIMFSMLTLVGIGLALLLGILYGLALFLAFLYSGILLGGLLARRFFDREQVVWHDGVLGMTVLSLIILVPGAGLPVATLLAFFSLGMLLQLFFAFAFPHERAGQEEI